MQLYETFIDCSTRLGHSFVAVRNAELCNNITSCMVDQNMFAMKTSCAHGYSCIAVERRRRQEFPVCVTPARDAVCRTVKQLEERGTVRDGRVLA
jgi:hypothetical protein